MSAISNIRLGLLVLFMDDLVGSDGERFGNRRLFLIDDKQWPRRNSMPRGNGVL